MDPDRMITYHRFGGEGVAAHRDTLIAVHADAYASAMDNPLNQRFPWFVDHWGAMDGFSCVILRDGDEPAGFAYGAPLKPGREWWRDHWQPTPEQDDVTTFAVSEIMLRPQWRRRGLSSQLHDALIEDRGEALAVLFVDETHPKVLELYQSWGYDDVGRNRPFADAPLYAVMLKQLRKL